MFSGHEAGELVARRLLVVIGYVLTARAASPTPLSFGCAQDRRCGGASSRHADPEWVAFKLMTWSWKLNDTQRGGLSTRQFVRYPCWAVVKRLRSLIEFGLAHV